METTKQRAEQSVHTEQPSSLLQECPGRLLRRRGSGSVFGRFVKEDPYVDYLTVNVFLATREYTFSMVWTGSHEEFADTWEPCPMLGAG